ncbi:uncharacterized protein LOC117110771 [Anneissia japonica]|uniref:uncharacterized protein LOC117110771 n=1 Tax=Anneissia japonica TaxID=1529436 RepID=UPI001425A54A|nr:uncharacterized protein LOC117110771 [Anneissia japonica]
MTNPEYERVLLFSEVEPEEDPSEHVSIQEAEERRANNEGSESAVEFISNGDQDGGLKLSDIGDGMSLIMEVKEEVEDQGYEVINQWDDATIPDFQKDESSASETLDICNLNCFDIKKEDDIDSIEGEQPISDCYYEFPLKIRNSSNLEKFLLHKFKFWVFHCPLCSSQQVFLHKFWLQKHLQEPFHKEADKISPEAQDLLQDLLKSKENFCPVETCQIPVKGSMEDFCKHLILEHIDTFVSLRKLCQINVFCQQNETADEDKYSLTVQLKGKWHTFYRTKASSEIQTSIKEDSIDMFPVSNQVNVSKMKMTVKVSSKKIPVSIKPKPSSSFTSRSSPTMQSSPKDSSKFCFNDTNYYKCPICPSLTVFFDVLMLKNHMIKRSHPLSSVCRVLKQIGIQHPTHTCPVITCNEDFGQSQKKQLKHIMTEHPEKYDTLSKLMDGCYQNFQSIAGVEGLRSLGIPQPQTISFTYRVSGRQLPTLKPKIPSCTSSYQNEIVVDQCQQQSTSALIGSHPTTSASLLQRPAIFTSIQSPVKTPTNLPMFPSSQTVRQILNSKMVIQKGGTLNSVGALSPGELTNSALPDSGPQEDQQTNNQQTSTLKVQSARSLSKPRPLCFKCGLNALSNIGLISHLFNDHCNLVCKICSFTAEPLRISEDILIHMKDVHDIDSYELEQNVCQSLKDLSQTIGVSQLDGLSCITQKKFILDELVVHYALVEAAFHQNMFQDDLIVRQVKKEGDEVWIEILVGEKPLREFSSSVNQSLEGTLQQRKSEDVSKATLDVNTSPERNSRDLVTTLDEEIEQVKDVTFVKNKEYSSSSASVENDTAKPTSNADTQLPSSSDSSAVQIKFRQSIFLRKANTVQDPDTDDSLSNQDSTQVPIGRMANLEQVSPSSGYNSPIKLWLIKESIKEIRLERFPFANSLHCLRCHINVSTNRGFILHIFACHSIDVCKFCFFDLSKACAKRIKRHLLSHSEYSRKQPIEDFLTLSCPEFMQLLGIPSLDQLCNITRDRIIFTFRVVWYRMAQVPYESDGKTIMQKNLTVNSSPKAGTPDLIVFFRNKHGTVIQVDNAKESHSEANGTKPFRPERSSRFPYYVALQTRKPSKTPVSVATPGPETQVNENCASGAPDAMSSSSMIELETTKEFVEGKDFTIVLQGNDRVFKCLKCTRAYWNKCKMRRHLKVHLNIRNYQCHLCQKSFHYNYHLKAHMNIHNNSRPYKCTKCSKSYNNSGSLSWHVRQCHGLCNFSKNKVNKIQCQVCFIQVRQELYHEHLRERHGVSVAYQYNKSEGDEIITDTDLTVKSEITNSEQDTEDEFPWRGELIVDEGDGDDEPDTYDLAPATAQNVFSLDDNRKDINNSSQKYNRQEVYQCTFCHIVYHSLPEFSMHNCQERPNKVQERTAVSKKLLQNYTETYTCSNCKQTSSVLETFIASSHPCALKYVNNFTCEKTYTCKQCQLIFTDLDGVQKHVCKNAEKQEVESEDIPEPEPNEPDSETNQQEKQSISSADLHCPVCNGIYSITELPYHLSSKHHLNKKVVFELMQQNALAMQRSAMLNIQKS